MIRFTSLVEQLLGIDDIDDQLLKIRCTAGGNALFEQLVDIDDIDDQVYVYHADKIVLDMLVHPSRVSRQYVFILSR